VGVEDWASMFGKIRAKTEEDRDEFFLGQNMFIRVDVANLCKSCRFITGIINNKKTRNAKLSHIQYM